MELRLKDGKYDSIGARLCTVSGAEELAQRVMMKLAARRGSFWPLPDYGSRLYFSWSGGSFSTDQIIRS